MMIRSILQGGGWMSAMVGVMLLTASPGLTSEQRSAAFIPGGLLPEAGEAKTKPTPWLDGTPWPLTLSSQGADGRTQPEMTTDIAIGDLSEVQTQMLGADPRADDLAAPDPIPWATSAAAADLDRAAVVSAQAWPLAQEPTPDPSPSAAPPQDEAAAVADLAAAAQNPIANLISLPFQNNTNFGVGPNNDRTQNVLNIQPVVPIPLSDDLLLVTRTILPIVAQPDFGGNGTVWGLGDLNPTFFFVPATTSNLTWGVGPTLVLPTATDRQTGTGKWSAGPAGVAVVNSGPLLYGGLVSQVWSFAGDGSRPDVNRFVMQPFATMNLSDGWFITSSPIITADWNASSGNQWTVPIGGGVGRLVMAGNRPINTSLQVFWNAVRPSFGADFTLRAQVQLLFPR